MANTSTTTLLLLTTIFSLSTTTTSLSLLNAADTLSNSGYVAMSLTLTLLPATTLPSSSLTIFAPPDSAFSISGQPTLSHLLLHLSPLSLSPHTLSSLPFSSKIPTLSPSSTPLTLTTPPSPNSPISLNNITITPSPIFDDGNLIVYGTQNFFDPNFTILTLPQNPKPPTIQNPKCQFSPNYLKTNNVFYDASGELRSRGYSIMGSFLEMQLVGFTGNNDYDDLKFTVFAPNDELMIGYSGDFPDYASVLLRHVIPCKLGWSDLVEMGNGDMIGTYLDGFLINVTKTRDLVMVNGIVVSFPDMVFGDKVVVHGISELLDVEEVVEPGSVNEGMESSEVPVGPHNDEF